MSKEIKEQTQIFQLQLHVIEGEYKRVPVDKPVRDEEFDERFISPNDHLPYHNTKIITPEMGWVPISPTFSAEFKKKSSEKDSAGTAPMPIAVTTFEKHRFKTLQSLLAAGVKAEMRVVSFVQSEVIKYANCGDGVMIHKN